MTAGTQAQNGEQASSDSGEWSQVRTQDPPDPAVAELGFGVACLTLAIGLFAVGFLWRLKVFVPRARLGEFVAVLGVAAGLAALPVLARLYALKWHYRAECGRVRNVK
jgi:hypothetical protein